MITLKQFLVEEKVIDSRDPQELADIIKRDCKRWLKEAGDLSKYKMFRGMNLMTRAEPILYKKNVRKDRQPKDTSKAVHGVFDEYFEKHFGLKMRSESIFTTGDISTASEYGQPYMVIPIGDYSYCWSPKVEDLTSYYDREINVRVKKMYDVGEIQEYDAEMLVKINSILPASVWNIDKVGFDYKKLIFDILDDAKYKDTGLKNAISSNHELMIACDSYYVLNNINRRNIALIYEVLDML